ncbi:winged helix-turn-helix domain-containing protein [Actinosynnema sp. NPDC023658]|uniref:winged helix-turn-helix domain-containing protein n=1 Tax=Actinosynnema sp. NPDC023658 TaxID=3155465 RepID=UPI0033F2A384
MVVSRTNFAWATLLDLGSRERGRLHDRVAHALRTAIRDGRLAEGAAVPPSRALAEELGCSRWVVTEAYGQLVAEGYLSARVGSATRVSWSPETPPARHRPQRAPAVTDRLLQQGGQHVHAEPTRE